MPETALKIPIPTPLSPSASSPQVEVIPGPAGTGRAEPQAKTVSCPRYRWQFASPASCEVELVRELGVSPVLARVLANRGLLTPAAARAFLQADIRWLHDPFAFADMEKIVRRLAEAIRQGERILVYGDYDADGITSTALLVLVLRRLGADVTYYIPSRLDEGYGLSLEGVARAVESGARLLITVDCGISAAAEVAAALTRGLEVIITDHHEPQAELPQGVVGILNPKVPGSGYPYRDLAGVGVAFKLAQALGKTLGGEGPDKPRQASGWFWEYLDLVTVGTVADVMPLTGENRLIVKYGLAALPRTSRPGLQALLTVAGLARTGNPENLVQPSRLGIREIGFQLAPRLNAAGRIGDAALGVELLLAEETARAEEIAAELDRLNRERQALGEAIFAAAQAQVEAEGLADQPVIVVAGEDWHVGVIGIVASRIAEIYNRPTILITWEGETGRGSGRSAGGFPLFEGLWHCRELLERFGGHAGAAGLTLRRENYAPFRVRLAEAARRIHPEPLQPELAVEAEIALKEANFALLGELAQLAPFGEGNPVPVFVSRALQVRQWRWLGGTSGNGSDSGNGKSGRSARHLRLQLRDREGAEAEGIAFRVDETMTYAWENLLRREAWLDLAFTLELDEWNGQRKVQLVLADLAESDPAMREEALLAAARSQREVRIWGKEGRKLVDGRGMADKVAYLRALLAQGARPFVYAPLTGEALVEELLRQEPTLRGETLFFGETLPPEKLVTQWARLGEGVWRVAVWGRVEPHLWQQLPQCVRYLEHTILCAPGFSLQDFKQAALLGEPAYIHLLFGEEEGEALRQAVAALTLTPEDLRRIYALLRHLAQREGGEVSGATGTSVAARLAGGMQTVWGQALPLAALRLALAIFTDLGLVQPAGGEGSSFLTLERGPLLLHEKETDLTVSSLFQRLMRLPEDMEEVEKILLRGEGEGIWRLLNS